MRDSLDLTALVLRGRQIRHITARTRTIYAAALVLMLAGVYLPMLYPLPGLALPGIGLIVLAILLTIYAGYNPLARLNAQRTQALREALVTLGLTPPANPQQQQRVQPRRSGIILGVFAALFALQFFLLVVAEAPFEVVSLLSMGLWLLYWLRGLFVLALRRDGDAEERFRARRGLFFIGVLIGLWAGLFILLSSLTDGLSAVFPSGGWFLLGIIAVVGAYFLWWVIALLPVIAVYRGPLARGDYDGALAQVAAMQRRIPYLVNADHLRAAILVLAGRSSEAEATLRALLMTANSLNLLENGNHLVNLGASLLQQERYEETLRLMETATTMMPERSTGFNGLVVYYLARGEHLERACEIADRLPAMMQRAKLRLNPFTQYDELSVEVVYALTLALRGQHDAAARIMQRAFAQADRRFQPLLAVLHFYDGRIKQQSGDRAAARAAWEQAAALDPHGANGQQARDLLASES